MGLEKVKLEGERTSPPTSPLSLSSLGVVKLSSLFGNCLGEGEERRGCCLGFFLRRSLVGFRRGDGLGR